MKLIIYLLCLLFIFKSLNASSSLYFGASIIQHTKQDISMRHIFKNSSNNTVFSMDEYNFTHTQNSWLQDMHIGININSIHKLQFLFNINSNNQMISVNSSKYSTVSINDIHQNTLGLQYSYRLFSIKNKFLYYIGTGLKYTKETLNYKQLEIKYACDYIGQCKINNNNLYLDLHTEVEYTIHPSFSIFTGMSINYNLLSNNIKISNKINDELESNRYETQLINFYLGFRIYSKELYSSKKVYNSLIKDVKQKQYFNTY